MNRSAGVTAAAVVMLVCSSLMLLVYSAEFVALIYIRNFQHLPPQFQLSWMVTTIIIFAGAAALGIVTGIGLLSLRNWARIITVGFSVFTMAMASLIAMMLLIVPMPSSPAAPPNFLAALRIISFVLVCVPLSIALWWLVYFSRAGARKQFCQIDAGQQTEAEASSAGRPASITIIGWYMIVCAVFSLGGVLRPPHIVILLVWVLRGWGAVWETGCIAILAAAAGVGLLKLRRWGFVCATAYLVWGILAGICMMARPNILLEAVRESTPAAVASLAHFAFSMIQPMCHVFGLFGILLSLLIFWFILKHRRIFFPSIPENMHGMSAEN